MGGLLAGTNVKESLHFSIYLVVYMYVFVNLLMNIQLEIHIKTGKVMKLPQFYTDASVRPT